jgi:SAM-dependent methyltransferase
MPLLRSFLDASSRLSARFDRRRKDVQLYARYEADVLAAVRALPDGALVVDLGGGRECSFARQIRPSQDVRIVAVDISPAELAANTSVRETRVADVTKALPFVDGEVDLLVSRTLLEHVDGLEPAVQNIARVLRPGAQTIHLLPCRYALFAIVARVVPFPVAKRLLHLFLPSTRGVVEFDVFYDKTYPKGIEGAFVRAGFRDVEIECTWDQAEYFHAIFPLFVLVFLYQRLVESLGIRTLAAYVIVRAVR